MGSAAEALWFGVPTVAIPQAVDQFTNADRLEAVGAGVHLPDDEVTARAPRARELRDEVRRDGGIGSSSDAVERLARG
jgi:UDP:flavonoid glycosyltransferase YjiC (YdhE family)